MKKGNKVAFVAIVTIATRDCSTIRRKRGCSAHSRARFHCPPQCPPVYPQIHPHPHLVSKPCCVTFCEHTSTCERWSEEGYIGRCWGDGQVERKRRKWRKGRRYRERLRDSHVHGVALRTHTQHASARTIAYTFSTPFCCHVNCCECTVSKYIL